MILNKQPKTFVIALKEHPISLSQLNDCLISAKRHNWEVETFWGTNGKTLSLESWNSIGVKPLLHKGSMNKLGTWGCFFSHWHLWNLCINLNEPIIILEHDAVIQRRWYPINISDSVIKLHKNYSADHVQHWTDVDSGVGSSSAHGYCLLPEHAVTLVNFCRNVGGYAIDRILASKVVSLEYIYPTLVERQNSYSTTENL